MNNVNKILFRKEVVNLVITSLAGMTIGIMGIWSKYNLSELPNDTCNKLD